MRVYFKSWVLCLSAIIGSNLGAASAAYCSQKNFVDDKDAKALQRRVFVPHILFHTSQGSQPLYPLPVSTIYTPPLSHAEYSDSLTPPESPYVSHSINSINMNNLSLIEDKAPYSDAKIWQKDDVRSVEKLDYDISNQANTAPHTKQPLLNAAIANEKDPLIEQLKKRCMDIINKSHDCVIKAKAFLNLTALIEPSDPQKAETFYKGLLAMTDVPDFVKSHACFNLGRMKHNSNPDEAARYYTCVAFNPNATSELQEEARQGLQRLSLNHAQIQETSRTDNH